MEQKFEDLIQNEENIDWFLGTYPKGLTNSQIVRLKYKKAWSQKHNGVFTIQTGEDRNKNDVPYRPNGAVPYGWKIGEGKTLKEAWENAAINI